MFAPSSRFAFALVLVNNPDKPLGVIREATKHAEKHIGRLTIRYYNP